MNKTDWFPADVKPVHEGWYEIQDRTLRCNCCCMNGYWDGEEFVRFGRFAEILSVYEVFRNVTRWRGLTEKA